MFKVLDLFSGAGGMAEGFLQAGFSIPYASDISEQAAITYKHRHHQLGHEVNYFCGDISKLAQPTNLKKILGDDYKNIDIICGGPPCQGFSIAGQRNPSDKRNLLVNSYIKILEQIQPKYFVMENVQGILSAHFAKYSGKNKTYKNKKVIDVLKEEFTNIGYPDVQIKMLDASDFGVPQQRQRVIFLGTRTDIKEKLFHPHPQKENKVSAKKAISDLENINPATIEKSYSNEASSQFQKDSRNGRTPRILGKPIRSNVLTNHQTSRHTAKIIKRFSLMKKGENLKELFNRLDEQMAKEEFNKQIQKKLK